MAAGTGLSQPGRPAFSLNMAVPSFVSTFVNPSMSVSVSSPSIFSLQNGATCNVANRSAMLALPLLDQPFIIGPSFSPLPAKLVAQTVAGTYIDLSDLMAVNLVQRELEPQLLFDGRLVLTSQPKKTVVTHQGHRFVHGGLCHLFPFPGLSLSEPLERSHAGPVADPENLPPFFQQSLARV